MGTLSQSCHSRCRHTHTHTHSLTSVSRFRWTSRNQTWPGCFWLLVCLARCTLGWALGAAPVLVLQPCRELTSARYTQWYHITHIYCFQWMYCICAVFSYFIFFSLPGLPYFIFFYFSHFVFSFVFTWSCFGADLLLFGHLWLLLLINVIV